MARRVELVFFVFLFSFFLGLCGCNVSCVGELLYLVTCHASFALISDSHLISEQDIHIQGQDADEPDVELQ